MPSAKKRESQNEKESHLCKQRISEGTAAEKGAAHQIDEIAGECQKKKQYGSPKFSMTRSVHVYKRMDEKFGQGAEELWKSRWEGMSEKWKHGHADEISQADTRQYVKREQHRVLQQARKKFFKGRGRQHDVGNALLLCQEMRKGHAQIIGHKKRKHHHEKAVGTGGEDVRRQFAAGGHDLPTIKTGLVVGKEQQQQREGKDRQESGYMLFAVGDDVGTEQMPETMYVEFIHFLKAF